MESRKMLSLILGIVILIWSILEWGGSFTEIAIGIILFLFVFWAIPSRFDRNYAVFCVMVFCIGLPVWVIAENFVEISAWLGWAWLGLSLVASIFFPFHYFRKFSPDSFH